VPEDAAVDRHEPDAIARVERAPRLRRRRLHREVDLAAPGLAAAHRAAHVDDHVARLLNLLLDLAHPQPADARAGLPRDRLERIARAQLAQLAQLGAAPRRPEQARAAPLDGEAGDRARRGAAPERGF